MTELAMVWLLRTAVGGGLVLLAGWMLMRRETSTARQQRLGEWAVAAALLTGVVALCPAWLLVPVPGWVTPAVSTSRDHQEVIPAEPDGLVGFAPEAAEEPVAHLDQPPALVGVAIADERTVAVEVVPFWATWRIVDVVFVVYALIALGLLGRWVLANLAILWLLARRLPVPAKVAELFAEMAASHRYRLIISDRVRTPFSVGLLHRTVVLPARLVAEATTEELRWVLAHELAHLDRQDTRTCWLLVLGQVFFFYLPWFWWLRRRVRLCQEYLADAAALEWAGDPADYAQFLVDWMAEPVAGSTGVSGSGSDFFRRVQRMLQGSNLSERGVTRGWLLSLGAGLTAFAVLVGGLGLRAWADEKKAEPKKPVEKKPAPKPAEDLQADPFEALLPLVDEDHAEAIKELQKRMKEMHKQMEQLHKQLGQQGGAAFQPFQIQGQNGQIQGLFPGGAFGGKIVVGPGGQWMNSSANKHEARLGAQVSAPSQALIDQLDLPRDQGLVLDEVGANSAAAKAGLKKFDILLELAGKTVPSKLEAFLPQLKEIKGNTPVDAVVMRKGKKETVKGVTLPEAKVAPAQGGVAKNQGGGFGGFGGKLGGFGGGLGGGLNGSTSIQRQNDEFTTKHSSGGVTMVLKGTIDQGKAKVGSIVIDNGGQKSTYDSIDKVPETYRSTVKKLATMSAGGVAKFPLDD